MQTDQEHHQAVQRIQQLIDSLGDDSENFAPRLRELGLAHISFSQVKSIEFCEAEYTWRYIVQREPQPTPAYFTKGKLLHQAIAASYRVGSSTAAQLPPLPAELAPEHHLHLKNAYATHRQNLWQHADVLAVERPFVMSLHPALPPVVGVIGLVLRDSAGLILVDHKTGRDFAGQDALQLAIYQHYAAETWGEGDIRFYYDHYRWVTDLRRIRKPAMLRQQILLSENGSRGELNRLYIAARRIALLKERTAAPGYQPRREGTCFICAYRSMCWR